METATTININEVLGHFGIVEFDGNGMFGSTRIKQEGRIIYSSYNASLFFMPKGSRNKGYTINEESDILSFELIRKDNKKNALYNEEYLQHEEAIKIRAEKEEAKQLRYKQEQEERELKWKLEREAEKAKKQQQIEEAKSLCNYDKLEKDVFDFYESSGEEYSESSVKNIFIPMLAKIVHKGVTDVEEFPKHFFDKKRNPRFCKVLESLTGIKLANTQKKNVDILNEFLKA